MATCIEFEGKKYTIEEFKNLLSDVKLDESKQSQIKPGIEELFESNPELANEVYSKILTNFGPSAENLLSLLLKTT